MGAAQYDVETFSYRLFNADGEVVYVGMTNDVLNRMACHKSRSPWFGEVARLSVRRHPNRAEAATAEYENFRLHGPRHNTQVPGLTSRVVIAPRSNRPAPLGEWGTRLRLARFNLRLSQADLAASVGASQSAISRIETGETLPESLEFAQKLAEAVSVPLDQLFPRTADEAVAS